MPLAFGVSAFKPVCQDAGHAAGSGAIAVKHQRCGWQMTTGIGIDKTGFRDAKKHVVAFVSTTIPPKNMWWKTGRKENDIKHFSLFPTSFGIFMQVAGGRSNYIASKLCGWAWPSSTESFRVDWCAWSMCNQNTSQVVVTETSDVLKMCWMMDYGNVLKRTGTFTYCEPWRALCSCPEIFTRLLLFISTKRTVLMCFGHWDPTGTHPARARLLRVKFVAIPFHVRSFHWAVLFQLNSWSKQRFLVLNGKVSTNSVLQNNPFHLHSCPRESSKEEPPGKNLVIG